MDALGNAKHLSSWQAILACAGPPVIHPTSTSFNGTTPGNRLSPYLNQNSMSAEGVYYTYPGLIRNRRRQVEADGTKLCGPPLQRITADRSSTREHANTLREALDGGARSEKGR